MNPEERVESPAESSAFLAEDDMPGASLKGRDPEILKFQSSSAGCNAGEHLPKGENPN